MKKDLFQSTDNNAPTFHIFMPLAISLETPCLHIKRCLKDVLQQKLLQAKNIILIQNSFLRSPTPILKSHGWGLPKQKQKLKTLHLKNPLSLGWQVVARSV